MEKFFGSNTKLDVLTKQDTKISSNLPSLILQDPSISFVSYPLSHNTHDPPSNGDLARDLLDWMRNLVALGGFVMMGVGCGMD